MGKLKRAGPSKSLSIIIIIIMIDYLVAVYY